MQPKWLTQDILLGVAIDMWKGDIGTGSGSASPSESPWA